MTAQAISALGAVPKSNYATQSNDSISKTDFLRLLITQLEKQDPLNPQDPSQFTAQLTQFSNLEQLINLNKGMTDLQTLQTQSNGSQSADLIGKNVIYDGNSTQISGGAASPLHFSLPSDAKKVTISVLNGAGQTVRTIEAGAQKSGIDAVSWDGLDSSGKALPNGSYSFKVTALDSSGSPLTVTTLSESRVRGILQQNGQYYLDLGNKILTMDQIYGVEDVGY